MERFLIPVWIEVSELLTSTCSIYAVVMMYVCMYVCCVLHCDIITGEPIKFPSNQVIKGWQEGLLRMKAGSKATMVIPSDLAYGDTGENTCLCTTLVYLLITCNYECDIDQNGALS